MNAEELRKILAAQRARRLAAQPATAPSPRRRSRFSTTSFQRFKWAVIVLVATLFLGGYTWTILFAKSVDATRAAEASTGMTMLPATTVQNFATSTVLPSGVVCTNVPEGRLHVRTAPGENNAEAGYLTEGEAVTISAAPTQTAPDGGQWIELLSPLSGWVNTQYICK